MFGDKSNVPRNNSFSSEDLYSYTEAVLQYLQKNRERQLSSSRSNYEWLRSGVNKKKWQSAGVEALRPLIDKMTSESCVSIAMKIDSLLDISEDVTPAALLEVLKGLLEEHQNYQLLAEKNITLEKRRGSLRLFRHNRVKPELVPPGREATVSFILEEYT